MSDLPDRIGPFLVSRGAVGGWHHVALLVGLPDGAMPPAVQVDGPGTSGPPVCVDRIADHGGTVFSFWRWELRIPVQGGAYTFAGETHRIAGCAHDMRIGFVSCNGMEHGDFDRGDGERNAMWRRMAEEHGAHPFALLLSGGDQIYADMGLEVHPELKRWRRAPARDKADVPATDRMEAALLAFFLDRWRRVLAGSGAAALYASVPGLCMWDDHDIMDGWGSHKDGVQNSPVGHMVFRVARRIFVLFQAAGYDDGATHLGFRRDYPGLAVLAPDLRSERTRHRVMSEVQWRQYEAGLASAEAEHVLVMSSVPALGPRLSLVEGLHRLVPGAQKYEDDLRDQWQSRAHREEWRRFLRAMAERAARGPVTVVSGEIHLATRGEMALPSGVLHQLTASGIAHPPPPRSFATALGWLATLGEAPLPGMPIRLRPLPGHRRTYVNERNYLTLVRQSGAWSAVWELEESGTTPPLMLGRG